jgi:phosphinothricin acetyltransferase
VLPAAILCLGMRIRAATEQDAEGVRAIYAPIVRETAISFEWEEPDVVEMARRIRTIGAEYPWVVTEDSGTVVGYAYAYPWRARAAYRWVAETAIYVAPAARRRGVARATYAELLLWMRQLGYRSAIGGIALPNPASVALHETLGFRHVSDFPRAGFKFGRWHDLGFWRLELEPLPGAPAPPLPPALPRPPADSPLPGAG